MIDASSERHAARKMEGEDQQKEKPAKKSQDISINAGAADATGDTTKAQQEYLKKGHI